MVHQYKLNGYNIVLDSCSGSTPVGDSEPSGGAGRSGMCARSQALAYLVPTTRQVSIHRERLPSSGLLLRAPTRDWSARVSHRQPESWRITGSIEVAAN